MHIKLFADLDGIRFVHAVEFLDELASAGRLRPSRPLRKRVAYHDPCDLGKRSGVYDAPRHVMNSIPGIELREMANHRQNSLCCGGGGNVESFAPEVSKAVSRNRIRQAAEVGASTLVSACQQCERTLAGAAQAERIRMRVKDITEIVLEAIQAED